MTLKVRKGKLRLRLCVPIGLALFALSKGVNKKEYKGLALSIDKKVKRRIKTALKQAKRNFKRLTLISVQSKDGVFVEIKF